MLSLKCWSISSIPHTVLLCVLSVYSSQKVTVFWVSTLLYKVFTPLWKEGSGDTATAQDKQIIQSKGRG